MTEQTTAKTKLANLVNNQIAPAIDEAPATCKLKIAISTEPPG